MSHHFPKPTLATSNVPDVGEYRAPCVLRVPSMCPLTGEGRGRDVRDVRDARDVRDVPGMCSGCGGCAPDVLGMCSGCEECARDGRDVLDELGMS